MPDRVYSVRWYGLQAAPDVTLVDPVAYPDICLTPLANFGIQILRTGLDDDTTAYDTLAKTVFEPVVTALANFRRDRAAPFQYLYSHDT